VSGPFTPGVATGAHFREGWEDPRVGLSDLEEMKFA
jgi:hypothetical protein